MFSKSIVALALAGGAIANPLLERGVCKDSCAAAVTGNLALGDKGIRESHCASYLTTTVTPPAYTTTVTITGTSSSHSAWKRTDVTYCPNTVPVYATSACGGTAAYSSACSCFGFTAAATTTVAPTTTTKTVYVVPTWASTCSSATSTVTVTASPVGGTGSGYTYVAPSTVTSTVTTTKIPVGGSGTGYYLTVTVTTTSIPVGATGSGYVPSTSTVTVTPAALTVTANATCATATPAANSTCLSGAQATYVVNSFINFLENTDFYVPGDFDLELANAVLASNFIDQSDSINFMIDVKYPGSIQLGNITFDSPQDFDVGQGEEQPPIPSVTTLNLEYGCNFIAWRWLADFGQGSNPVQGINLMYTNAAGQLEKDYSEFDNAAWLQNYNNPQCAAAIAAAEAATAANCTSAADPTTTGTSSKKRAFNPANYRVHKRTPNNMLGHY
jgi:hypothetical protein